MDIGAAITAAAAVVIIVVVIVTDAVAATLKVDILMTHAMHAIASKC